MLFMSGLGAIAGAVAAWIAYAVREPERRSPLDLRVDELTLSDEKWAIVGLSLLGALVCGGIAAAYVARKGPARLVQALIIAAPLGAFLCWGSRWLMDFLIYARLGGPDARVDVFQGQGAMLLPFMVWQICVGFALTMPVVVAIGANRFTFFRGLIGALLVVVFGIAMGEFLGILAIAVLLPIVLSGNVDKLDPTAIARVSDVLYLFSMGAAAGLAFAVAEALWKPAWLKSYRGATEGRAWTLGELSRIGCTEGLEVRVPPDGRTAPVHAQIQAADEGHFLVDLVGGTTLNGALVHNAWLGDGDRIGVGTHELVYRSRLAPTGRPPSRAFEPAPAQPAPTQTAAAPPDPCLVDAFGTRHRLRVGRTVIGREPGCDLVLGWEPTVSKRHAEIILGPTGLSVRDLGSTNGTFLNDVQLLSPASPVPGDTLRLGNCRLRVEA